MHENEYSPLECFYDLTQASSVISALPVGHHACKTQLLRLRVLQLRLPARVGVATGCTHCKLLPRFVNSPKLSDPFTLCMSP